MRVQQTVPCVGVLMRLHTSTSRVACCRRPSRAYWSVHLGRHLLKPWVPSNAWRPAACARAAAGRAKVVAGAAHDDDHRRAARCQGADAGNERRDRLFVFGHQRLRVAPALCSGLQGVADLKSARSEPMRTSINRWSLELLLQGSAPCNCACHKLNRVGPGWRASAGVMWPCHVCRVMRGHVSTQVPAAVRHDGAEQSGGTALIGACPPHRQTPGAPPGRSASTSTLTPRGAPACARRGS